MAMVQDNWERLVRATLRREQLRTTGPGRGHERHPSGLAGAVPPSLGGASNIDAILQAADEIQDDDPTVARILCEQAYSMAQNLDPNSEGRGVLMFKSGLMSVIKHKHARRDVCLIDRSGDVERLWEFYHQYKQRHNVGDIQHEEQKWRESGVFSTNFEQLVRMRKVFATLRALVEVMQELSKDAAPQVGRLIMDELRRIEKSDATFSGELIPYNIIPLEAPSLTNAIGVFPERHELWGSSAKKDIQNDDYAFFKWEKDCEKDLQLKVTETEQMVKDLAEMKKKSEYKMELKKQQYKAEINNLKMELKKAAIREKNLLIMLCISWTVFVMYVALCKN